MAGRSFPQTPPLWSLSFDADTLMPLHVEGITEWIDLSCGSPSQVRHGPWVGPRLCGPPLLTYPTPQPGDHAATSPASRRASSFPVLPYSKL